MLDDAEDFGRPLVSPRRIDAWLGLSRRESPQAPAPVRGVERGPAEAAPPPAAPTQTARPAEPPTEPIRPKAERRPVGLPRFNLIGGAPAARPFVRAHSLIAFVVIVVAAW
ncbi:MAG TPA: hypothetical protein VEH77_03680, partial [Roseiarcus sp.]|nr:hypothetical protein [Roseiarcus sp.]